MYPVVGTRTRKKFIQPGLYKIFGIETESMDTEITIYNERLPTAYLKELLPFKIKNIKNIIPDYHLIKECGDRCV